jgi:hypothetical protein
MKDIPSRPQQRGVGRRRAALKAVPSKQLKEMAESANRARFAKTKKSRQPRDKGLTGDNLPFHRETLCARERLIPSEIKSAQRTETSNNTVTYSTVWGIRR